MYLGGFICTLRSAYLLTLKCQYFRDDYETLKRIQTYPSVNGSYTLQYPLIANFNMKQHN